ncbi:MAG: YHYH protein [Myxococcota bacterium]
MSCCLALLAACDSGGDGDDTMQGTSSGDAGDTGEAGSAGITTNGDGETGDAGDAGDTGDTSETSDTGGPGEGPVSTADVLCSLSHSVFNDDESVNAMSTAEWFCDETTRTLSANGLPDHEVGTFPNPANPNAISAQTVEIDFPLFPEIISEAGSFAMIVAYCLNGVKFEVGTGGTCNDAGECSPMGNGGQWRMEAVGPNSFDFGNDDSHGHVQPTGAYHYHGIPEAYLEQLGKGEAMTLVGWAVDGFPIYARYGYTDPMDADSEIMVVSGSYQLKQTPDEGRPSVEIYPLGAFTQDWEYAEGSGDLDECNGRMGVTPEFPEGIYHYYLTDSFPFGQRCVKGDAGEGGGGPGGGGPGGGGPGGGGPGGGG